MPIYSSIPTELEYQYFLGNLTKVPGAKIETAALTIVQICAMVLGMLAMGLAVDLSAMLRVIKRPWGVMIGLLCQFLIMPLVGLAAVKTGLFGSYEVLVVMLYGTCPGGGVSNFFTYFLKLNVDLSVTMTNVSALLSFGFIPLWLLLVPKVVTDVEIIVPFKDIAIGVAQLVGPFIVGALINYKWTKAAKKAARILTPIATLVILIVLILLCIKFAPTSIISTAQIALAALMPLIGGSLGFAFAFVLNLATMRRANLSIRDCFTIGMETGVQNAQIAITIVTMLYAGKNMYAFSQQFFFPVLCFVFQFAYWVLSMVILVLYKLSKGQAILPQNDEHSDKNGEPKSSAQTNPAFELSDDL